MNIAAFDIDGVLIQAFRFGLQFQAKYGISDSEKLEHWNVPLSPSEVCDMWFRLDGEIIQSGIALLEECRLNYDRLIITSTQEQYRADYIKSTYGFMRHINHTFFSCEVGLKKPQPEYYQQVERSLCGASITFFDDSIANVHAAIECGWKGYHYNGETSLKEFLI